MSTAAAWPRWMLVLCVALLALCGCVSRHSIIAVRESSSALAGAGERDFERIAYTAWGRPVDVSKPYDADFNNDGNVDQDDITDLELAIAGDPDPGWDTYLDINGDGAVNGDDLAELALGIGGGWPERNIYENRFLWRGYWYDPYLNLYHVRHRVYDPALMRWLQPDPAGYVDGYSLYAYCGGRPHDAYDPYGLARDEFGLPTDPDEPIRAGHGERDARSQILGRQAVGAGNAYLDTIGGMFNPLNYLSIQPGRDASGKHVIKHHLQIAVEGVMHTVHQIRHYDELSPEEQGALGGGLFASAQITLTAAVFGGAQSASRSGVMDVGYGAGRPVGQRNRGIGDAFGGGGVKRVVIGENMRRVEEAARRLNAKHYDGPADLAGR